MIGRTDLFELSGKRSCLAQDTDECETGGIDNSVVTLKKLTGLLCTSELSDIELAVGTRVFHVHKLILCMSSEVLRVMLTNPQWPEFYQRRIVLKEEPECVATFDKFLKYLYSGLAELTPESALPLLMLADKYSVTELSQLCVDYMCAKSVHAIRKGRIVSWLRYAHMCGYQELEGICHKMATWNFRQVTLATDFITMQKEVLLDFLKSSDLVIHDEYALYVAAKKWLLSHKGSFRPSDQQSGFKELIFQVLSHIKFPLISLPQFKLLQNDELAEEAKEFFQEKITLGMKYHCQSFEERQVFESSSKETEQFFPRNYTSETWNTTLTMENFGDFCERVMRLMYFSSPVTGSAADSNLLWEWQMEVYPKGVRFGKCMLIGLQESFIVPEEEYDTVRMAIKSETSERKRVELAVLVSAEDGSVEYVRDVVTRQYLFDSDSQVCIMDDIISYQALNSTQEKSTYLCGQNKDTFKVMIVIKPLESR